MNTSLRLRLALLLVFLPFVSAYPLSAAVIYVDASASGANNGSSWADAYKYLQDALTAAGSGTEIRVAQGTYRPDANTAYPDGNDSQYATFQLKDGVALYGGFPQGGGSRDPNIYETILSGDIGIADNNNDNSYHIVTGSGTNSTAILDGFTITAGNANSGVWPDYCGGGMYNYTGSPTIANCKFNGNSVYFLGGGILNLYYSSPALTNCTFSDNSAGGAGGGIYNNYYSSPTLTICTFTGNSANQYGGGISNEEYSSTTVINCTFSGNSAHEGGGIGNYNSNPTLTNCSFSGNSATNGGGMQNYYLCSPTVTNCTFSENSATRAGGGMHNYGVSNPAVTNCTFSGNSAVDYGGGGIYNEEYSSTTVINCTFSGNSAHEGGGIGNYNSSPTITNCILWDNTATTTGQQMYNYQSTATVSFSDVQGGWSGTGNINADPLFVDADGPDNIPGTEDDNLRLSSGSPCIDAGDNTAVPEEIETDLDGRDRFVDGDCNDTDIVDMGAFEFTYAYFGDFDSDCDVDFLDYAILANVWLTDEFLADIAPTPAGDGLVDNSDLAVLCDNWLHGTGE